MRAWASRLWQAQAALDLYLDEMRRCEDAGSYPVTQWSWRASPQWRRGVDEKCELADCGHYPRIRIEPEKTRGTDLETVTEAESAEAGSKQLHLSREQLWTHISRKNDHFDHLLLFLRSRRHELKLDKEGWKLLKRDLGGPHWGIFRGEESNESSDEDDDASRAVASRLGFKMDTAEDLLDSARDVIGLTRQLRSLSLTGFLFRALDGLHTASSLTRLSIGPFARWWEHVLSATDQSSTGRVKAEGEGGQGRMTRLARLRICGMLSDLDALKIATELSSLEMVVWEMTDRGYVDA